MWIIHHQGDHRIDATGGGNVLANPLFEEGTIEAALTVEVPRLDRCAHQRPAAAGVDGAGEATRLGDVQCILKGLVEAHVAGCGDDRLDGDLLQPGCQE